jgi:hypothetical protein
VVTGPPERLRITIKRPRSSPSPPPPPTTTTLKCVASTCKNKRDDTGHPPDYCSECQKRKCDICKKGALHTSMDGVYYCRSCFGDALASPKPEKKKKKPEKVLVCGCCGSDDVDVCQAVSCSQCHALACFDCYRYCMGCGENVHRCCAGLAEWTVHKCTTCFIAGMTESEGKLYSWIAATPTTASSSSSSSSSYRGSLSKKPAHRPNSVMVKLFGGVNRCPRRPCMNEAGVGATACAVCTAKSDAAVK